MSTIWTPGGEYAPRKEPDPQAAPSAGSSGSAGSSRRADAEARLAHAAAGDEPDPEMLAEAARIRDQILAAPAADMVANHAIGLFEVAALHLGAEHPRLDEAQLCIDAMAALVEGLGARLGRHERVLRDGLAQLQMAFVQAKGS